MLAENGPLERTARIADRLAAARRSRFVGRMAELDLLRSALLANEPPFSVLHVCGPGGVGKSTLLREYARVTRECGRPVVHLDARNLDPTPPGFLTALRQALGLEEEATSRITSMWPDAGVLIIDTYETIVGLDSWLRETLLPELPTSSVVIIAGRHDPSSGWRTDVDWAALTRILPLQNLRPEESQTYLATRGIPDDQHGDVLSFTHGHPLALALVADVLGRGDRLASFDPRSEPDVVRALLERLVQDVPTAEHRLALGICVQAWTTTEALLASVLGLEDAHDVFEWLRGLSFIETGPYGLFPHDVTREALDADYRWRNLQAYVELRQSLMHNLYASFERARGIEQQRIWSNLMFLHRHNPTFAPYFEWSSLGSSYANPATPEDHAEILAMVRRHQGEDGERIARYWLGRQPSGFLVFRGLDGDVQGFLAHIELHDASSEDIAMDPAVPAVLQFVERHGPVKPGDEIAQLRFWMDREAYQRVSPAINLTAINVTIYWLTHPRLAWSFIATVDPEFMEPHFASIHVWRSPEADFEVDGQRFGVFSHDWRVESASEWMNNKTELAAQSDAMTGQPQLLQEAALPRPDFDAAVRQALRDYTRPDRLMTNPLLKSHMVRDAASQRAPVATLQDLLRDAASSLTGHPRDLKFHRAVWHTFIEPAPSQERAAELLELPFNTYRYQLAKGIERISDWLWQREQNRIGR